MFNALRVYSSLVLTTTRQFSLIVALKCEHCIYSSNEYKNSSDFLALKVQGINISEISKSVSSSWDQTGTAAENTLANTDMTMAAEGHT